VLAASEGRHEAHLAQHQALAGQAVPAAAVLGEPVGEVTVIVIASFIWGSDNVPEWSVWTMPLGNIGALGGARQPGLNWRYVERSHPRL
jgi:hypothetical protein